MNDKEAHDFTHNILKQIQARLGNMEGDIKDIKSELISVRTITGEMRLVARIGPGGVGERPHP